MKRRKFIRRTKVVVVNDTEEFDYDDGTDGEKICYICLRTIHEHQPYRGGKRNTGEFVFRHDNGKCIIGSANWLKSDVAKHSAFYKFYREELGLVVRKKKRSRYIYRIMVSL